MKLRTRDEAFLYFLVLTLMVSILVGVLSGPIPVAFTFGNGTVHKNNNTAAFTGAVIKIAKDFAIGEIPNWPRLFVTPSTGSRAAAADYQIQVRTRHRDATLARTVTGARAGGPVLSTTTGGGNGLLTSVQVANSISTATTSSANTIAVGDQIQAYGTPTATNSPKDPDNMIVHEVVSPTQFRYASRFNTNGTFSNTATTTTYNGSGGIVTVTQKIDPYELPDSCRFQIPDHNLYRQETVNIPNTFGGGFTITNPSASNDYIVTGHTEDWIVINAQCSGTWSSGGTVTGPNYGSVFQAVIKLKNDIPASNGTIAVDYENTTVGPCAIAGTVSSVAACAAAGMDKTAMLAMSWNGLLETTADVKAGATATIPTDARAMLTAADLVTPSHCGPRVLDKGPIDTEVILEYGCLGALTSDFGYKIRPGSNLVKAATASSPQLAVASRANIDVGTHLYFWTNSFNASTFPNRPEIVRVDSIVDSTTTCDGGAIAAGPCLSVTRAITGKGGSVGGAAQPYGATKNFGIFQWEDATDGFKSLHPIYYLRFIPGVGVEIVIEVNNTYYRNHQNLWYTWTVKTGFPTANNTRVSSPTVAFKHLNSTSWSVRVFDPPTADPDFFCGSGAAGTDPEKCGTTGGGNRTRRIITDHNAAYMSHAKTSPPIKFFANRAGALDSWLTGWRNSDMGAVSNANSIMGSGTYGAQFIDTAGSPGASSALKAFDGAQEGHMFNDTMAMWFISGFSEAGYEIMFGTRVPGGGGNVEVTDHIPWNYADNFILTGTVPGFKMPGFADPKDSAFGKYLSLYNHPTWIGSTDSSDGSGDHPFDERWTSCGATAPLVAPVNNDNSTDVGGTRGWPCHHLNSIGFDDWVIDYTHQTDWNRLAYQLTGHVRYLKHIYNSAAWYMGQDKNDPGRGIGKSWSQPENRNVAARGKGNWTRAIVTAAIYAPTEPQFGFTKPMVDTFYWREKVVDHALAAEGMQVITNGLMSRMYPQAAVSVTCPGGVADTSNIWWFAHCKQGLGHPNAIHIPSMNADGFCTDVQNPPHVYTECSTHNYGEGGWWWQHHGIAWWGVADDIGWTMFRDVRLAWFNLAVSMNGSDMSTGQGYNPYMGDLYRSPFRKNGPVVQSLQDMWEGLKVTWNMGGTPGGRGDQDWCHQSGLCGQPNVGASSYPVQWLPTYAMLWPMHRSAINAQANLTGCATLPGGPRCTWDWVWNFFNTAMVIDQPQYMPKYVWVPHGAPLDLSCTASPASTTCTYKASNDQNCYYGIGPTMPVNDTGFTSDGKTTPNRTLTLTGAAGTQVLTMVCGQRLTDVVSGTGWASTPITFLSTGSIITSGQFLGSSGVR